MKKNATKKQFYIDCFTNEYSGISFGEYWNGWEVPYFTEESAKLICDDCKEITLDGINGESVSTYIWDNIKNYPIELIYENGKIIATNTVNSITHKGIKYYPIAARYWTWASDEN